jgi:hypothetical protein
MSKFKQIKKEGNIFLIDRNPRASCIRPILHCNASIQPLRTFLYPIIWLNIIYVSPLLQKEAIEIVVKNLIIHYVRALRSRKLAITEINF